MTATKTSSSEEPQEKGNEPNGSNAFDWENCWYPVTFLRDLPKDRPTGFTLYDEPLVLFFDGEQTLSCLRDKCVHRAARLSDGHLVDGRLECGYHGWQFGADGKCLHIPQLPKDSDIPQRACVRSYPVEVRQGIVWIWAGNPEQADPELIITTLELDDSSVTSVDFQMDLPYDQSYLIENVIDVAHIHIAHDGVRGGGERASAKAIKFDIVESSMSRIRAKLSSVDEPQVDPDSVLNAAIVEYVAPNLIRYTSEYRNAEHVSGLELFSIPLGKSRCRLLYRKYSNFTSWKESWKPRWLEHWTQCLILEQDMGVVIGQHEEIERATEGLKDLWFPIKTSDLLVLEFRRWLDKYGENLPFYRGFLSAKSGVENPFYTKAATDRYSLHTKVCSTCTKAYRNVQRAINFLWVPVVAFGALGIVNAGEPASRICVAVSVLSLLGIAVLTKMKRQFE